MVVSSDWKAQYMHGFQRRWLTEREQGGKESIISIRALQFITLSVW